MIALQRYDLARNLARYDHLLRQALSGLPPVDANLFGEWSLVRAWGRIDRTCQMQVDLYTSLEAAEAALERKAHEKRRKGYG